MENRSPVLFVVVVLFLFAVNKGLFLTLTEVVDAETI